MKRKMKIKNKVKYQKIARIFQFRKLYSSINNLIFKKKISGKRETKTDEMIRRFRYNKSAVFGLILILLLVFCAIFANFIAPNDPTPSPPELEKSL